MPNSSVDAPISTATVAVALDRGPASGHEQYQRDQHAELRLVGQQPEQNAREHRAAVQQCEKSAEQRCGEECVLAVADIDEHGGKRSRHEPCLAPWHDGVNGGHERGERDGEPAEQRERIGHQRKQAAIIRKNGG
jgi:hypothetical protein